MGNVGYVNFHLQTGPAGIAVPKEAFVSSYLFIFSRGNDKECDNSVHCPVQIEQINLCRVRDNYFPYLLLSIYALSYCM